MQENKKNNIDDPDDEEDDEMNKAEDELQPNDYNVEDEPFFLVLANYFESELVYYSIIYLIGAIINNIPFISRYSIMFISIILRLWHISCI